MENFQTYQKAVQVFPYGGLAVQSGSTAALERKSMCSAWHEINLQNQDNIVKTPPKDG